MRDPLKAGIRREEQRIQQAEKDKLARERLHKENMQKILEMIEKPMSDLGYVTWIGSGCVCVDYRNCRNYWGERYDWYASVNIKPSYKDENKLILTEGDECLFWHPGFRSGKEIDFNRDQLLFELGQFVAATQKSKDDHDRAERERKRERAQEKQKKELSNLFENAQVVAIWIFLAAALLWLIS